MTREIAEDRRIHELFNELHRALTDDLDHERDLRLLLIRSRVDAAHHDYAIQVS
jgi:hypothetical protein